MNTSTTIGIGTSCRTLEKGAGTGKVALIFHLKIEDFAVYENWLVESENKFGSRRLYRIRVDPAPREGMLIDEIIIDEHSSAKSAFEFISNFSAGLKQICSVYAVLAIVPESPVIFLIVKAVSSIVRVFKGVKDKGIPASNWKAENITVWPDENQMNVARDQDLDEPLFVYNLNKYKAVADYQEPDDMGKQISGQEAYDRYAKIAGFELLRRGAFPVYGGKPICLLEGDGASMLEDHWDKFIFVRYPQRRNLLAMTESNEFHKGQIHRDAGLERVAIFMGREA